MDDINEFPTPRRPEPSGLLEENRRLAQRYLELEESARRRIDKLEAANATLKKGDSDLRRLIEVAAFGFMLLNKDLCFVSANRALCELLGYAYPDLSGLDFRQFVYVEKLPAFIRLAGTAAKLGTASADIDILDAKGSILHCRFSAGRWDDEKNQYQGVFILVMDISHEIRAAKRIKRLRIAAKENEKTRQLLLDIVGREIRSPVNSIIGMTRMLLETKLDDRQHDLAGVIHSSASLLGKLVDNLLDIAELESDDVKIRLHPVRLAGLVLGVTTFFANWADEKGVILDVSLAPGLPEAVMADSTRVRRVLTNLVDNALKFTDAGRVTISVDALADKLRFMVSDTGRGLYSGAGEEIFDNFANAGNADTRRFGGLGAGLSIAKRLVSLMGGQIGFESSQGRGSEFHFYIPLVPVPVSEISAEDELLAQPAAIRLPPQRILLVEANPLGRRSVSSMLRLDGHEVVAVEGGLEAADRLRNGGFDVILLDMHMASLDGLQTLKIIRDQEQSGRSKRTPALAMVAAALAKPDDFYLSQGFDGAVLKPVRSADLMQAISKATGVKPLAVMEPMAEPAYIADAEDAPIRRIDARQFTNIREVMFGDQFIGVFRVFIEESVPDIMHIIDMAQGPEPDRERIAFIASKTRGMAGYLGMSHLAESLAAVEQEVSVGTSDSRLAELAEDLHNIMDDTLVELKRIAPGVFKPFSQAMEETKDAT